MLRYRRIAVTVKTRLEEKEKILSSVIEVLRSCGADIFIDAQRACDANCARAFPPYDGRQKVDLHLVIGGDGTILRAVREISDYSVPLLTINRGSVGFLAELAFDEMKTMVPKLLSGEGNVEERAMLSVRVQRRRENILESIALNEIAVSQGAIARLLDLRTSVGNESLAVFHADGLIIATPTGSTAYSLAAGGPVVHPRLRAMILTPINPHSFTQKPLVIPGESVVTTEVVATGTTDERANVSLTLDGQTYVALHLHDVVTVTTHADTVKFIRRNEDTFYRTLRAKLKWG